jgi:uncharacterized protein (DUF302 family)
MSFDTSKYGYSKHLASRSIQDVKPMVVEALKQQGFGVLTEIDIRETFKKKLNAEFQDYLILGACNPTFAHQALQGDLNIGLLLPCNVCLWAENGGVTVAMVRPDVLFRLVDSATVEPVARQVNERLRTALDAVA